MTCARLADDKKGTEIRVLAMGDLFPMAEYFVLATGANRKHIQTIAEEISKTLKTHNRLCLATEGYDQGWWVLIDYGEVVVHVFAKDARDYYDLENLWGDAEELDWQKLSSSKTGS